VALRPERSAYLGLGEAKFDELFEGTIEFYAIAAGHRE
jgi:hypothetical protein